ncbi:hypothetical protein HK096_009145, partial [Nowakowskiella sp. JEL0078]
VTIAEEYTGDVVKFAGDAMLIVFRNPYDSSNISPPLEQKVQLIEHAAACCLELNESLTEELIYPELQRDLHMGLHFGLCAGSIVDVIIGNKCKEYPMTHMTLGDGILLCISGLQGINQMKGTLDLATVGNLAFSEKAMDVLKKAQSPLLQLLEIHGSLGLMEAKRVAGFKIPQKLFDNCKLSAKSSKVAIPENDRQESFLSLINSDSLLFESLSASEEFDTVVPTLTMVQFGKVGNIKKANSKSEQKMNAEAKNDMIPMHASFTESFEKKLEKYGNFINSSVYYQLKSGNSVPDQFCNLTCLYIRIPTLKVGSDEYEAGMENIHPEWLMKVQNLYIEIETTSKKFEGVTYQ